MYKRNTPVFVESGRLDTQKGYVESFTLLFQHFASFTFSMAMSQKLRKDAQKQKEIADAEKAKKKVEQLREKQEKAGKGGGKSAAGEEDQTKDEPLEAQEMKADIGEFGVSKENCVYKCKFIVPNASEIIYDERDMQDRRTWV